MCFGKNQEGKGVYMEKIGVVVSCTCIEILILRLFLGGFRRGKRVLGIVTHFCLLSAKFKGF